MWLGLLDVSIHPVTHSSHGRWTSLWKKDRQNPDALMHDPFECLFIGVVLKAHSVTVIRGWAQATQTINAMLKAFYVILVSLLELTFLCQWLIHLKPSFIRQNLKITVIQWDSFCQLQFISSVSLHDQDTMIFLDDTGCDCSLVPRPLPHKAGRGPGTYCVPMHEKSSVFWGFVK